MIRRIKRLGRLAQRSHDIVEVSSLLKIMENIPLIFCSSAVRVPVRSFAML